MNVRTINKIPRGWKKMLRYFLSEKEVKYMQNDLNLLIRLLAA